MGIRLLSGKTVEGSISVSGTIDAANGVIGPVTVPGPRGDAALLGWSWSQTGGPSKLTLERSMDGGTTWKTLLKSDGTVRGGTLYGEEDAFVARSGFQYRLKSATGDFVAGTVVTGSFF